jgi:hypothetical protein
MPDRDSASLQARDPERARHLLMLEFGSRSEFDDPRLEYRRLFSELLGTFFLVLVAAGGGVLHAEGQISLSAAVVAPGLMVMAIILFMGAVSGAHLNPAVSLAFALRGDFAWKRVPGYITAQLLGATLASLFLLAVLGNVKHLGATLPGPGYRAWQAFLMEIALTATLISVILGTASAAQHDRRACGRGLYRPRRSLGGTGERHVDESRPFLWARARQRRLEGLLGVPRWTVDRRGHRRRGRRDLARQRWRSDRSHSSVRQASVRNAERRSSALKWTGRGGG